MNDILSSIAKWFKERTTSPLYGTFVLSLVLWNWKFFYILFWQSEDKLSLPRIEYVQQNFLNQQDVWFHLLYFLILPLTSTYLIIWWFPIFTNWAHRKHIDFYYKKMTIIDEARLSYEKRQKKTLDLISVTKEEQAVVKKKIEKNTSEEDRWSEEYEMFKGHSLFNQMGALKNIIYSNNGVVRRWNGSQWGLLIGADILASADSKGLIARKGKESGEMIELTPKGKFFMSKYLDNE